MTVVKAPRGRLLGTRAAAEYLGITESRVRQLLRRGELASIRTRDGRLQGIYEQDCDAWVEAHRRPAVRPTAPPAARGRPLPVDERMKALMPKTRIFG